MSYAIFATRPGDSSVLVRQDRDPPAPAPGQVLIRHAAIGVNFIDVYFRQGLYPWPVSENLVLGSEGSGVVEALGDGVTGFSIGQRVAYTLPNGSYATHRAVPAAHVIALPDDIDDATAAAVMLKGLTAHYLLHHSHPVQADDTVLFHAAAGGVGLIAGQWLAAKGVRAIGTAGGPEKCALARANGFADCIDYRTEDFVARIRELTGGKGVQAVYDSVGADTIMGSLDCLATFGTLVSFGQSSGAPDQVRVSHLARASLRMTRPSLFHHSANRAWLEQAASDLFAMIRRGAIKVQIGATWPLDQAAAAHDALTGRATTGCIVLIP
ncbi:quinone oxidoreductase family protein [Fuscovulum ytuae]|uniref:Quinone oxidoreductase n=1 Tax=Fuscovulum ytuae TaxID=3042299 RepID=A0ABY8QB17_9RHOB|nr:quinone oxidoreductase [Fuscovulum sp. YMD61]WGV17899.1 quinone oxidoreductase [Fuscovulum sp. YMD61]